MNNVTIIWIASITENYYYHQTLKMIFKSLIVKILEYHHNAQ